MATTERGTAVMDWQNELVAVGALSECAKNKSGLAEAVVPRRSRPSVAAQPHQNVRSGRLKLEEVVTQRVALDDIAAAAEALDRGEITGRAILTF